MDLKLVASFIDIPKQQLEKDIETNPEIKTFYSKIEEYREKLVNEVYSGVT